MVITADELYSELRGRGLSHNHALGMVANAKGESSFNPSAIGDAGSSYGLFQWHGPRASALESMTPDWRTNWRGQIDYAMTEPDTRRYLQQEFATPAEATEWFTRQWERPADPDRDVQRRVASLPGLLSGGSPAMANASMISARVPAGFSFPRMDTSPIELPDPSMAQLMASNPFLQMGLGILGAGNLGGASQGLLAAAQAENQFAQMQQRAREGQQDQRRLMFESDMARANLGLKTQQAERQQAMDQATLDWRMEQARQDRAMQEAKFGLLTQKAQREQQQAEVEKSRLYAARQLAMDNAPNDAVRQMVGLGMMDDRLPDLIGPPPAADPSAVQSVRKEFTGLKNIQEYEAGQRAFNTLNEVLSTTGNPADSLAALYTFMRSLDPASVVRESEQSMFLKSEGPLASLAAEYNRIMGEGRITDSQRKNLMDTAKKMLAGRYKTAKKQQEDYSRIARERYSVDPFYVVGDPYSEPELPDWAKDESTTRSTPQSFAGWTLTRE